MVILRLRGIPNLPLKHWLKSRIGDNAVKRKWEQIMRLILELVADRINEAIQIKQQTINGFKS